MNLAHKLVIGTAQFGLNYGINNQSGQVSKTEVKAILNSAYNIGLRTLDTSSAYGTSELVLGEVLEEHPMIFRIISKYPQSLHGVEDTLRKSLLDLRQNQLYGYLVHHFEFYRANPSLWNDMVRLKENGLIQKIGFSLYSPNQLEYLLNKNIHFNLLQFPYNIFDRQFEPCFSLLKELNVEIHIRSVFLQGLFFKNISSLNERLTPLTSYLQELYRYSNENEISVEELALNYVTMNPHIDGVLIGVDNKRQLDLNIKALDKDIRSHDIDFVKSLNVKEYNLLNPANW